MRWLPVLLFACACGDTQDSDLDGDGLRDEEDDCVDGFPDRVLDLDFDGKEADVDLCPHDQNAAAGDTDLDGIPDACDPFIAMNQPDTRRCITSFQVRWMNAAYLIARHDETPWTLGPEGGLVATAAQTVSTVSDFPVTYRSATFDVLASVKFGSQNAASSFRVWLRAIREQPTNQDVACGVSGDGKLWVWADNARHSIVDLPAPLPPEGGVIRLRSTVQPGTGSTILCRASVAGVSIATTYGTLIKDGLYGFSSIATDVRVESMVIDTNDAAPQF